MGRAVGIDLGTTNSVISILEGNDPQVVNNAAIHEWEHPTVGPARMARPPVQFSATTHETVWSADELGASTDDVLHELGYPTDTIADLRRRGVIGG